MEIKKKKVRFMVQKPPLSGGFRTVDNYVKNMYAVIICPLYAQSCVKYVYGL
jgi:hypothetical protein